MRMVCYQMIWQLRGRYPVLVFYAFQDRVPIADLNKTLGVHRYSSE